MTALIFACAIPLLFAGRYLLSGGAVALGAISLFHTRRILASMGRIAEQRIMSGIAEERLITDDRACRSQIFSSVDTLSAGIAHEINNPLGIIAQEIQWIGHLTESPSMRGIKEAEDLRDSLREISRQVDRCKETVHKLLSLARQVEPVLQFVDVNELIRSMVIVAERQAAAKKITIVRRLESGLPVVASDPPLLRQVLLNLLLNATQAIDQEGVITVSTRSLGGEFVEIKVQDNGCGIPREHLARIFTPFFSTKPEGKGTGLGLAISRGIIERLGGSIDVSSEPGESTTFTIRVPVNSRRVNATLARG
ncbi:MAG: hypothetical protein LDL33_15210 [Desulfomonile sp.]|nr:hypothetical protein [Desulfomonile sp.]